MIRDVDGLVEKITSNIRSFCDIAVLGMSGGADSTLVAILCKLALGKEKVFTLHMPYNKLDKDTFNERSWKTACKLGVIAQYMPVDTISDAIIGSFKDYYPKPSPINLGNARSRARMCVLYGVSSALHEKFLGERVRVIGTGNLSEDYIGYDTKGGDALADLFPVGELFKSEVYQLLDHFKDQGIIDEEDIDRIPSAGLWDGQTDESELGYTYDAMEPPIKRMMTPPNPDHYGAMITFSDIDMFVRNRHAANKHKHEASPAIPLRSYCD